MHTISDEPALSGGHTSRCVVIGSSIVCYCSPDGTGARRCQPLLDSTVQDVRARIAADIEASPIRCPVHDSSDCSALLNGCSLPGHLGNQRQADAQIARGTAT